jgi:hypothetical protein
MEQLRGMVGTETAMGGVARALHMYAADLYAPVTGAMLLTCADESEQECVDAFHNGFVRYLLPSLKFAQQSAFHIANLGGRYEWNAVRVAEDHYATAKDKLLVVSVNAHVGAVGEGEAARFGVLERYGAESACCGALHGMLEGSHAPHAEALREAFLSEGVDRLAAVLDPEQVDPAQRSLRAAIASSRLHARSVILDIQDYEPVSSTLFLVASVVTINRAERDTEILCGLYTADYRRPERHVEYFGLGDDPAAYDISFAHEHLVVTDEQLGSPRPARNHRQVTLEAWRGRAGGEPIPVEDEQLDRIRADVSRNKHRHHHHSRLILQALLTVLSQISPVTAAMLLFAEGGIGIHHAWKIHRLARDLEDSEEARRILLEVHDRVDSLDQDQAEAMIELLVEEFRG